MRHYFSVAGVVVLMGCFMLVVTPEESRLPNIPFIFEQRSPTIILDAGHGGRDNGARKNGLKEKDLTLSVAQRVEMLLKSYGYEVILTRRDDRYVALEKRAEIANEFEDSIFVSIHFNSHASSSTSGIETFYSTLKRRPESDWTWIGLFNKAPDPQPVAEGEELAAAIQTALVIKTNLRNRGIKSRDLSVTRNVYGPAVLVEAGFISNRIEATLLKNGDYRQRVAAGITEGILSYLKSRKDRAPEAEPTQLARVDTVLE
jgi:N-acetylmuramoyl-L-alanine amidase